MSDTGNVRGNEFVRRIQGSDMTTVRNLKDEVDKRAYHKMLKQLGLSEKDFE